MKIYWKIIKLLLYAGYILTRRSNYKAPVKIICQMTLYGANIEKLITLFLY